SSTPLAVLTNNVSPTAVTEQLEALCGDTPSLPIMSSFQTTSASSLFWFCSSLKGPSFSLSRKPSVSRQTISSRLVTYHRRFPSTYGVEQAPRSSQSLTRPAGSFSFECCHRNFPVSASKQINTPISSELG